MSLVFLKNLLFAAERKRQFPTPDLVLTNNMASASPKTEPNLPPTPPSSQNPSPKDSEISWLSSESSSGLNLPNPTTTTTTASPAPAAHHPHPYPHTSLPNSSDSTNNEKQGLSNVVSVPDSYSSSSSSSSSDQQLPGEEKINKKNNNNNNNNNNNKSNKSNSNDVESDETTTSESEEDDLEGQKQKKGRISARMISDAIIGISDGMTVPFALTAGLAYLGDTKVVVLGGLAELIAGALSMGLGGFIGAKSEAESYRATVLATEKVIATSPSRTSSLIRSVLRPYSLPPQSIQPLLLTLQQSPSATLDFLMRFHHQTPPPDASRPFVCAITISMGYFLGGLVPLIPYFCVRRSQVYVALYWSIGVMAVALFVFGWVKTAVVSGWRGKDNVWAGLKGALQMIMIGGAAAGAAVGLVRAIGH